MNPADELLARLDGRAADTIYSTGDPLCKEAAIFIRTLTAERDEARERIGNAAQSMAETQPSWEALCHSIMASLGLDFGGPPPDIPEQDSWYALNLNRANDRAEKAEAALATAREEGRREMAEEAAICLRAAFNLDTDIPRAGAPLAEDVIEAIRQAAQTEGGGR